MLSYKIDLQDEYFGRGDKLCYTPPESCERIVEKMVHRYLSPTTVNLVLNKDCNHRCAHCYNPWRSDENCKINDVVEIRNKIDYITEELIKSNVWSVILTGGEPLLHPDILFYCIDKLSQKDISLGLNTNLTLITNDLARELVNKYCWNNIILTSLPSIKETTCDKITQVKGSYHNILKGISICKNNGIKVGINTVLTKQNINDLKYYPDFVDQYDIDYVSISAVIPPVYDSDNHIYYLEDADIIAMADTLLKLRNEKGLDVGSVTPFPLCVLKDVDKYISVIDTTCTAALNVCTIDVPTGDVLACAHEVSGYGNIYKDGLIKSWNNMTSWAKLDNLYTECKKCKWLMICGGECRMMRRNTKGRMDYTINRNTNIKYGNMVNVEKIPWPLDTEKLRINKFKARFEPFGVLIKSEHVETIISEKLYKFCCNLREKDSFTIAELKSFVENFDTARNVIDILIQRKIIVKHGIENSL